MIKHVIFLFYLSSIYLPFLHLKFITHLPFMHFNFLHIYFSAHLLLMHLTFIGLHFNILSSNLRLFNLKKLSTLYLENL